MTKGPGRIERAIQAIFDREPDWAFTVEDLIDVVFRDVNQVEKKHRVSVLRAAKKVVLRSSDWTWFQSEAAGRTLVFWNNFNARSYAAARIKGDCFTHYRSRDPRTGSWLVKHDSDVREMLSPGGEHHDRIAAPDGDWWKDTQRRIAMRDGDTSPGVLALFAEKRDFFISRGLPDPTPPHIAELLKSFPPATRSERETLNQHERETA